MNLTKTIAEQLSLPAGKVQSTIDLLEQGNTIPFIARYRKEVTGTLDEEQIRNINETWERLKSLEERREVILQTIADQGKLTDELKQSILEASTMTTLEDLYQPYRPKRRTRAMIAREKGLEQLGAMIIEQQITNQSLSSIVKPFLNDQVTSLEDALAGAKDIVAEEISENALVRQLTREKGLKFGKISSEKVSDAKDEREVFQIYYQFECALKYLRPHQVLALNRGEREKILRVKITIDERDWRTAIRSQFSPNRKSLFFEALNEASDDCANRLLLPSIERDIRNSLTEDADAHAIDLFAKNLKALLTQPPLADQVILAIDPGFRTGSKVAVIDETGKLLETGTIYPHPPQNQRDKAKQIINALVAKHHITLIVIGNGTASRETEMLAAEITKENTNLHYLITSEAGASVYSASKLARKEFPDLDVSIRGAVSIGRRVQDPLAELVKIDPKSIGVGLYQHDVNQANLNNALDQVVESVVNSVGVELNTASGALLTHIVGIGPSLAEKVVQYREENGPFQTRDAVKSVPGMGPKSFEQAAGFLRIREGANPLDATAIHPESYGVAAKVLAKLQLPENSSTADRIQRVQEFTENTDLNALAKAVSTGVPTLTDILDEIARPGRDPREDLPKPILRVDVLKMDDLTPGMQLKGTIRNVVDFGAFVDIGVKTDGLLHRSRIPRQFHLQVGDIIDVIIQSIDKDRNRIALEMKESNPS
ncbi:MAG: RNA-binding transcriptional accessory protein [Anaerolineaceae bacterium]|nr:RNA-binding transcriptional accessory protein [Anaerolineaceae bacterium]